jgi:phosphonate metabolism protein PhnN/1,5-bisphosphokinase (PRPP-forming)
MTAPGIFVAVVGPSGAGKDSLIGEAMTAFANDPRFVFPRRVVTRPPDGTEPHDSIDELGFRRLAAAGGFALHWEAHGLSYGIPASAAVEIARGRIVIANVSRGVLSLLRQRFPRSLVVEIAASPEVLAARLARRGREAPEMQRSRLERAEALARTTQSDILIMNDGPIEEASRRFVEVLTQAAAPEAALGA